MDLIAYQLTGYNSYGTLDEAELYFESRLNADSWNRLDDTGKEAALITAFQSLQELSLDIDLKADESPLESLTFAQFEQALWETIHNTDLGPVKALNLGRCLAITMNGEAPARHSPRTLAILRPYLAALSIRRTR